MASRRRTGSSAVLLLSALVLLAAGALWFYLSRPPSGPLRLSAVAFSDLPGWRKSDPRAALSAFGRSCAVLSAKSTTQAMTGLYGGTAGDWQSVCTKRPAQEVSAAQARSFFERWFVPFQISAGDRADGLFTGYYEPQLNGSRTQHGRYQTPVYALPDDLITVDLGLFRIDLANKTLVGLLRGSRLVPYPARADIDAHGLPHARILFYADDPISVFFLHIQGSGRVRLDDGTTLRAAYAGQNGRPYTAIGRVLMERGMPRQGLSMQAIRAWLAAHPKDARAVMERDQSFVFFKTEPVGDAALGAKGAQGVPLTPRASLAVDAGLHVLGAPFYVAASVPDADPAKPDHAFEELLVGQDTGGAIKGPVRGDIFFGFGADAESVAGREKSSGTMYVLLPKPLAARLGEQRQFAKPEQ